MKRNKLKKGAHASIPKFRKKRKKMMMENSTEISIDASANYMPNTQTIIPEIFNKKKTNQKLRQK